MDGIEIVGGVSLNGQVAVQGSKNSALPMMAAAFLGEGISVLEKCPRISDVFCMEEILNGMGVVSWWKDHDLYLDCRHVEMGRGRAEGAGKMRSSVILLGAMAGRLGEGAMGYPGGCVIGERPVDLHLYALRSLGIRAEEMPGEIRVSGKPEGNVRMLFGKKSVGATEQALLAGALCRGEVLVENCAREPEVWWLALCLNCMGAVIKGAGTDRIQIRGAKWLRPFRMQVPSDRIVAGTYLLAGAATRGQVTLLNPPGQELGTFLNLYRKMGGQYVWNGGKLVTNSQKVSVPLPYVETGSYPGFPTDLQSPLMAVLAGIPGESVLRERIFEDRYGVAEELRRMEADIRIAGELAVIHGRKRLLGSRVCARELRGGAALIVAGLSAEGETLVENCGFIRRGYEDICSDIACLGGRIEEKSGECFYENIEIPHCSG